MYPRNNLNRRLFCLEERAVPATAINPYAQVEAVVINSGEEQRSMVTFLRVEFDRQVEFMSEPERAFDLVNLTTGESVEVKTEYSDARVILTFFGGAVEGGSLADGRYSLRVIAAEIDNGKFDGNGDGEAGDDFVLEGAKEGEPPTGIYRLFGDVNGDGFTDLADFTRMRKALGTTIEVDRGYVAAFDADGDGHIDLADFVRFRQNLGKVI